MTGAHVASVVEKVSENVRSTVKYFWNFPEQLQNYLINNAVVPNLQKLNDVLWNHVPWPTESIRSATDISTSTQIHTNRLVTIQPSELPQVLQEKVTAGRSRGILTVVPLV